jgi:hypothetical protein
MLARCFNCCPESNEMPVGVNHLDATFYTTYGTAESNEMPVGVNHFNALSWAWSIVTESNEMPVGVDHFVLRPDYFAPGP